MIRPPAHSAWCAPPLVCMHIKWSGRRHTFPQVLRIPPIPVAHSFPLHLPLTHFRYAFYSCAVCRLRPGLVRSGSDVPPQGHVRRARLPLGFLAPGDPRPHSRPSVSTRLDISCATRSLPFDFACRNYVDQQTALATNLSFATDDTFIMRADSFNVVDPSAPGRNSVRIQSNNQYTTHVSVYVSAPISLRCGHIDLFRQL